MIQLIIDIVPFRRKRLELMQTLDILMESLHKNGFTVSFIDTITKIAILIELKDEKQLDDLLNSSDFLILKGAVKTLSSKYSMTANGKNITRPWL